MAQLTISATVPKSTPVDAKIFLASSLNNWNPNDEKFQLTKKENGVYEIQIPENSGSFEYKLTLGSWDFSETNLAGNAIENRKATFSTPPQHISIEVEGWSKPQEKLSTQSKNVKILSDHFTIPQLNSERRIWIYLPADYATSSKKYPVIYMVDGQNLFDNATSFSGEWKIDETLDAFAESGKFRAIVVGIDNGGAERLNEYSPWKNEKYNGGGKGERFTEFLVHTLKPYIDKSFRTLPQASNTALIGSSMGGLISLYAGTKYPNVFGKLGIFSPAFWFAENDLHLYLNKNQKKLQYTKFYFLAGQNESETMVSDIEEIETILKRKKVPEKNILLKIDQDGTHSENYWAREFPAALMWLFGKNQDSTSN